MTDTTVKIKDEMDIVAARQAGREMAQQCGFGSADQTRLATAISELTRNVVQYAGTGACVITDESNQNVLRIRIVVEDHGPGIPDIEEATTYGFSTGVGLGAGLPGTERLVDEFAIESEPGHTKVTIAMIRRKSSR